MSRLGTGCRGVVLLLGRGPRRELPAAARIVAAGAPSPR